MPRRNSSTPWQGRNASVQSVPASVCVQPPHFRSRLPAGAPKLILGKNGVFKKAQGTNTADEDHANANDPITPNTPAYGGVSTVNGPWGKANTGQRFHGRQTPGVGDRSVPSANSTAISKRAMFASGGGGGGSGVWPAEEGGGGGGGRRGGMGKKAAFARIAAKSTVSNAFRRCVQ